MNLEQQAFYRSVAPGGSPEKLGGRGSTGQTARPPESRDGSSPERGFSPPLHGRLEQVPVVQKRPFVRAWHTVLQSGSQPSTYRRRDATQRATLLHSSAGPAAQSPARGTSTAQRNARRVSAIIKQAEQA